MFTGSHRLGLKIFSGLILILLVAGGSYTYGLRQGSQAQSGLSGIPRVMPQKIVGAVVEIGDTSITIDQTNGSETSKQIYILKEYTQYIQAPNEGGLFEPVAQSALKAGTLVEGTIAQLDGSEQYLSQIVILPIITEEAENE